MAPLALPVLPGWRSLVTRGQSTSRSGSATRDRSGKSARDPMGRVGSNPAGRKPQPWRKVDSGESPTPGAQIRPFQPYLAKRRRQSSDLRKRCCVARPPNQPRHPQLIEIGESASYLEWSPIRTPRSL